MYIKYKYSGILTILFVSIISCKKFVEVNPPVTRTTGASVYLSDATAIAALTGIYAYMNSTAFITGKQGISVTAGLSADEFKLWSGVATNNRLYYYYTNKLFSNASGSQGVEYWSFIYNQLYTCNSAIEGLTASTSLTESVKQQLLGEAKFMRAFFYFYLVNLYGDAPLVTSTDYKINAVLARSSKSEIYDQIIKDLLDAQDLLSSNYLDGSLLKTTSDRVRPNKGAANALLARVYLYTPDWTKADASASNVINNAALYDTTLLNNVFLKNSKEAIWQFQPVNTGWNTEDARVFIIPSSGPNNNSSPGNPVYLSKNLLNSFEPGDKRAIVGNWIGRRIYAISSTQNDTVYYPYKYKSAAQNSSVTEYLTVLRLAEQYLIRAEARAQLGNTTGALTDLNVVRKRAGLANYSGATDKASLLAAILHERQVELFTEWGHRWLDLKRTSNIDVVMNIVTPQKAISATWQSYKQLFPIPFTDIQKNPNLVQNLGY